MLTIEDLQNKGLVLTDAEKEKIEEESAAEVVTDKRFRYNKCDCGKKKKYKNQRCPECTREYVLACGRERAKEFHQKARDKKASLHNCDICRDKHFTIFEYIGLELCSVCTAVLVLRERIRLIRIANDITRDRSGITRVYWRQID